MRTDGKVHTKFYRGPRDAVPVLSEPLDYEKVMSVARELNPDYPHGLSLMDKEGFEIDLGYKGESFGRGIPNLIKKRKGNLSEVIIRQMVEEVM